MRNRSRVRLALWRYWRQTEAWEDRFEEQVKSCEGALWVPELNLADGINSAQAWIRKRVFQSFDDSPTGQVVKLADCSHRSDPGSW